MEVAWGTDIHLDFLDEAAIARFARNARGADAVLISGDLSNALRIESHLEQLSRHAPAPLFVLGNHDFYGGGIEPVRARMRALDPSAGCYLPSAGVIRLSQDTICVGVDGWGDARLGNLESTPIQLNDFLRIEDLCLPTVAERNAKLRSLGDAEARLAHQLLTQAAPLAPNVLFVTHVPPFREACWHEGMLSGPDWLPFFTCAAVGEALLEVAAAFPETRFLTLCGHTHSGGVCSPAPNVEVRTGAAHYGQVSWVPISLA